MVLSYGGAVGISALIFKHVIGFEGAAASWPLLGIDARAGGDSAHHQLGPVQHLPQRHIRREPQVFGIESGWDGGIGPSGVVRRNGVAATSEVLGEDAPDLPQSDQCNAAHR